MFQGTLMIINCPHHQSATALGKLGHPDGELNLTKAAAKHGVIQMVSIEPSLEY